MAGNVKRRWAGITAAAVLVALVLPTAEALAGTARIKAGSTLAGTVLTNGAGYVLLMFPKEGHRLTDCIRVKPCMTDWPPVTTIGRPVAGPGIDGSLLGTIPYRGTLRAVTYDGWPLHTYKFAYSAETSVINIGIKQFGGHWYALDPAGKVVR